MKILAPVWILGLWAFLFVAAPATKEFNVAVCGPTSYSENHIVISKDAKDKETISFVSGSGPNGTVVKDKDPLVCNVLDESVKDGITKYVTSCKLDEKSSIDLVAITDGKKFIALVKYEGRLTAAVFGVAGPESELSKGALGSSEDDQAMCMTLVSSDESQVPQMLGDWLKGVKLPPADTSGISKTKAF